MYISLWTVCLTGVLILFCRDPDGTVKAVLGLTVMYALGAFAIAFMAALFVLPGVFIALAAGYIDHDTAGALILVTLGALVVPPLVWGVKELRALVRDVVADTAKGLDSVSRRSWMLLGAGGVLFASVRSLSPLGAVLIFLAGVIVWAVRKPPINGKKHVPAIREAQ
jgi:hypothetical protein